MSFAKDDRESHPAMTPALSTPDYAAFLAAVKERVLHARTTAARAVNRELILLYWDIGRGIVEKQQTAGWGESVAERLAADLRTEFPDMRGFSARNLRDMKRMWLAYSDHEFWRQAAAILAGRSEGEPIWRQPVAKLPASLPPDLKQIRPQAVAKLAGSAAATDFVRQLVAEIPWGHQLLILNKLTDPAARLYYLRATAQLGWSRSVLLNQIKAGAY